MKSRAEKKRGNRKTATTRPGGKVAAVRRGRVARARRRNLHTPGQEPEENTRYLELQNTAGAGGKAPRKASRVEAGKRAMAPRGKPKMAGPVEVRYLEPENTAGAGGKAPRKASRVEAGKRAMASRGKPKMAGRLRAALLAILFLSFAALLWTYTGTGVLNVKNVEIRGNQKLDAAYLRSLSGITPGTHLLKMNVKAVEKALLSEPYIAQVSISRRFPNTVVLDVRERVPEGMISQSGKYHLVDQQGIILESAGDKPPELVEIKDLEVPLLYAGQEVSGRGFANVTALLGSMPPELKEMTTAVGYREGDGLYLESRGTKVIYGEASDLARKNNIALLALQSLVNRYSAVEYIDVSFPDHPVIKPAVAG